MNLVHVEAEKNINSAVEDNFLLDSLFLHKRKEREIYKINFSLFLRIRHKINKNREKGDKLKKFN